MDLARKLDLSLAFTSPYRQWALFCCIKYRVVDTTKSSGITLEKLRVPPISDRADIECSKMGQLGG